MFSLPKKIFYLAICSCLTIGLVAIFSNNFLAILHSLVDIIAGGRSYLKVWLLLLFLTCLLLWGLFQSKKNISLKSNWLFLALGSGLFLNFLSTIYFYFKYRFPLHDFLIIFNQGQITSTKLFHSHIFKTAWGRVFSLFSYHPHQTDAGIGLVEFLPKFLPWIFLIIFLSCLLGAILYFKKLLSKSSKPIFFIFIYGVLTFSILKNIIDGGLLNPEAFISLLGLCLLVNYKKNSWKHVLIILGVYLLLILGLFTKNFWLNQQELWFFVYKTVSLAALIFSIIFFYQTPKPGRLHWLILLLGIISNFFVIRDNLGIMGYRQTIINKTDFALIADYNDLATPDLSIYKTFGNLKIYKYQADQNIAVGQLIRQFNLLDNYHPISVPWITCLPNGQNNNYTFELNTTEPINTLPGGFGRDVILNKFTWLGNYSGLWHYQVDLSINSCLPRQLNIIDEFIKQTHQSRFIINGLNLRQWN